MATEMRMLKISFLFELYNLNKMKRSKMIKSGIFGIKLKFLKIEPEEVRRIVAPARRWTLGLQRTYRGVRVAENKNSKA